jgi:hypothetical protein
MLAIINDAIVYINFSWDCWICYRNMNLFGLLNHLSPLQDPPAPTKQIPICVSPLLPTLLVLNTGLGEYGCTFTVIANMDNESRLSAMTIDLLFIAQYIYTHITYIGILT